MFLVALTLAGCAKPPAVPEEWMGRWIGPEGTYLELAYNRPDYTVTIQSLDGVESYRGTASAEGISFERAGQMETIRAGTGEDTGMKWLLDKENCLYIKTGEGFCR